MDIYTILSDSHIFLYKDFFLKSISKVEPKAKIHTIKIDQVCDGEFYSEGWHKAMSFKIDAYIDACKNTFGKYFIWSDVDIEFYEPFIKYSLTQIGDKDIIFQESHGSDVCAGFFLCKSNQNTLNFFQQIKNRYDNHGCDQDAINYYKSKISYTTFKNRTIWSPLQYWSGGPLDITRNAKLAHANYVIGTQNKMLLLIRAKKTRIESNITIDTVKIIDAYYGKCNKILIPVEIDALKQMKNLDSYRKFLYLFLKNQEVSVISERDILDD